MLRLDTILFPTDFSACAEGAFSHAAYLAARTGAEVHILHVEDVPQTLEALPDYFTLSADELAQVVQQGGHPAAPPWPEGLGTNGGMNGANGHAAAAPRIVQVRRAGVNPSTAIRAYADQIRADLIVMGTHGWRGLAHVVLGSVAEEVVRSALCPVLTVNREGRLRPVTDVGRVLVPVDFSPMARHAVRFGQELAALYNAHLDLLHVIEPTTMAGARGIGFDVDTQAAVVTRSQEALERLAAEADGPAVPVHAAVRVGPVASTITGFADFGEVGCIILPTHGRTGLRRLMLGSVAERVVRTAPCPVLTLSSHSPHLADETPHADEALAG